MPEGIYCMPQGICASGYLLGEVAKIVFHTMHQQITTSCEQIHHQSPIQFMEIVELQAWIANFG